MGNAVACSKTLALETCSDSVWYFISFNPEYLPYKGACHDSQTDPLGAPLLGLVWQHVLPFWVLFAQKHSVWWT